MHYDTAKIRQFLTERFDDTELRIFCFDYFLDVNHDFTDGMSKSQKIQLLLEHCRKDRERRMPNLLAALQAVRPDQFREAFPAPPPTEPLPPPAARNPQQIFISHAHQDAAFAHRLATDLQQQGWAVWIAPESIRPGEKWQDAINRGLEESSIFVLALTPASVKSRWVRDETHAALDLYREGTIQFIPLLVQPCQPPPLWRIYQHISFEKDYTAGLQAFFDYLGASYTPPPKPSPLWHRFWQQVKKWDIRLPWWRWGFTALLLISFLWGVGSLINNDTPDEFEPTQVAIFSGQTPWPAVLTTVVISTTANTAASTGASSPTNSTRTPIPSQSQVPTTTSSPLNTAPIPILSATQASTTATPSATSEGQIITQSHTVDDPNATLRAEIESRVSLIRSLPLQNPVATTVLGSEELRQRVQSDLLADFTEADAHKDVLVYAVLDFLPRDFDLYAFSRNLYSEQITGFYDPETNEFVVVSDDDALDANEQLTHAHEYMHALQDQHFNLDLLDNESVNADVKAALLALAEGEAVLLQSHYVQEGYVDIQDLMASLETLETPVLDNAPPVLANSLLYPYTAGLIFAQTLYERGGYAALNAVWANLPQSTEQILHPERYLAGDTPQLVTLPPLTDTLGAGWTLVDENVLGEFMLREYLSQQLNPQQVDTAVTGWGGDRFAVYTNEDSGTLALVLRLLWDTDQDATEFAALYPNYPATLFDTASQLQGNGGECWQGSSDTICLFQTGRETLVIRAPDQDTAVRLYNEIQ